MGRCSQIARERKEERREKREERESLRRRKIREGKIQDSRESNSNGAKSSEPSSSSLPTCKVTVVRFYKGSSPPSSSSGVKTRSRQSHASCSNTMGPPDEWKTGL